MHKLNYNYIYVTVNLVQEGCRMLKQIEIIMDNPEKIGYNSGSIFHGVLMEKISSEFAQIMHSETVRSYAQYVVRNNDKLIWRISILNAQADEEISNALLDDGFSQANLKSKNLIMPIESKKLTQNSYSNLFKSCYINGDCDRYMNIKIVTPMAFKSNGRYVNYPNLKLIYSSLIKKYDANSLSCEIGIDTITELFEKSEICRYDLKSCWFYLEKTKIPSFIGEFTIKINGNSQLVSLANMLFKFGEYSGIGIKTALGMGAIKIKKRGNL